MFQDEKNKLNVMIKCSIQLIGGNEELSIKDTSFSYIIWLSDHTPLFLIQLIF